MYETEGNDATTVGFCSSTPNAFVWSTCQQEQKHAIVTAYGTFFHRQRHCHSLPALPPLYLLVVAWLRDLRPRPRRRRRLDFNRIRPPLPSPASSSRRRLDEALHCQRSSLMVWLASGTHRMPGGHEQEGVGRRRPWRRRCNGRTSVNAASSSPQLPRRTQRGQNSSPRSVQAGWSRHEARCSSHFSTYLRTDGFSSREAPVTSSRRLKSMCRIRSSYNLALNDVCTSASLIQRRRQTKQHQQHKLQLVLFQ